MYAQGYNTYKNNTVNYASKEQLLLLLVDGAVKFAKRGRLCIEKNDIKGTHEALTRTQDIFTELMATLDTSAGKWAKDMFKIYEFIKEQLMKANMKKDIKILDETMPLIEEVRDIWHEAYKLSKAQ